MSDHPITSKLFAQSPGAAQDANARWVYVEFSGGLVGGEVRHRGGSRRRAVDMMVCRPRAGVNGLRASLDSQEACGQFCCVVRANIVFHPRLGRSERDGVRGEDSFNCRVVRSVDNQERPRAGAAWLASVAELVFSCFNEWRFCGHRRGFRCGVKDRATIAARLGLVGLDSVINSLSGFVVAVIKIEVVGDKPSVEIVAACLLAGAEHVDDRGWLTVQIPRTVNGANAKASHGIAEEFHRVAVKEVAVVAAVVFGFDVSRSDGCSFHCNVFRGLRILTRQGRKKGPTDARRRFVPIEIYGRSSLHRRRLLHPFPERSLSTTDNSRRYRSQIRQGCRTRFASGVHTACLSLRAGTTHRVTAQLSVPCSAVWLCGLRPCGPVVLWADPCVVAL